MTMSEKVKVWIDKNKVTLYTNHAVMHGSDRYGRNYTILCLHGSKTAKVFRDNDGEEVTTRCIVCTDDRNFK